MSKNRRLLLLVLVLVGLASAVSSLYVHIQISRQAGYLSFCDVSATISCTDVYKSPYAYLLGVPVALLGALWYVAVLLVLAGGQWGWPSLRENAVGYVFALATAGLGFVLYMAYASLYVLKTVCLMCLVTYVAVAGVFVLSGMRMSTPMTTLPRRCWRDLRAAVARPAALVLLLVFIVGATSAIAFVPHLTAPPTGSAGQTIDRQSEFTRWWESQPRVTVPVSSEGAAILIVKFSDFQCGACAQSHLDYKDILARYQAQHPGVIRVVTKDYPLESECNPNLGSDKHPAACEAAVAARLARNKGRGEVMEDWLYSNAAALTPASVRQAAREIAGVLDFDAQYPALVNQVKSDIALATVMNIKATPTFFVNGVRIEGGLPRGYLELALQLELKKVGAIR